MSEAILVGVLVIIFVVVLTAICHIPLRVPFVPTSAAVIREVIRLAHFNGDEIVFDLGAGDGRFLIGVKKQYPDIDARGCEWVPTVWFLGKVRIWLSGVRVRFRLGNALKEDIRDADVIFLYLMPLLMERLEYKFNRELKPGTRVISSMFRFPERRPSSIHEVFRKKVYVYEW